MHPGLRSYLVPVALLTCGATADADDGVASSIGVAAGAAWRSGQPWIWTARVDVAPFVPESPASSDEMLDLRLALEGWIGDDTFGVSGPTWMAQFGAYNPQSWLLGGIVVELVSFERASGTSRWGFYAPGARLGAGVTLGGVAIGVEGSWRWRWRLDGDHEHLLLVGLDATWGR